MEFRVVKQIHLGHVDAYLRFYIIPFCVLGFVTIAEFKKWYAKILRTQYLLSATITNQQVDKFIASTGIEEGIIKM